MKELEEIMTEQELEEYLDEMVAEGIFEVTTDENGEKLYRATPEGDAIWEAKKMKEFND
jgi:predicted transcriptional regulator